MNIWKKKAKAYSNFKRKILLLFQECTTFFKIKIYGPSAFNN